MFYSHGSYPEKTTAQDFMYKVYGWMSVALTITASVAYYVFKTPAIFNALQTNPSLLMMLMVLQFGLVIALSFFLQKMTLMVAGISFMAYAVSVGISVSSVFFIYTQGSVYTTFLTTAGMFGVMSLYGYTTRSDLTSFGSMGIMMLFGLIIGGLVNMFFQNPLVHFFLSALGVIVFTLLTAYDTQKIKQLGGQLMVDRQTQMKIAIIGALALYLDFINLFLYLLRFMGQRRKN